MLCHFMLTKSPGNNKTSVWLLYMPEAQMPNIYKTKSGLNVWDRKRSITKWSISSAWWRWKSARTVLFHIDWKISGRMIKARPYSALPGPTARLTWFERYDWKICCHGNSIEAPSLLQCFGLVLKNQVTAKIEEYRREKNSNERWEEASRLFYSSAPINGQ